MASAPNDTQDPSQLSLNDEKKEIPEQPKASVLVAADKTDEQEAGEGNILYFNQ